MPPVMTRRKAINIKITQDESEINHDEHSADFVFTDISPSKNFRVCAFYIRFIFFIWSHIVVTDLYKFIFTTRRFKCLWMGPKTTSLCQLFSKTLGLLELDVPIVKVKGHCH